MLKPGEIVYLITEPKDEKMQLLEHATIEEVQQLVESRSFRLKYAGCKLQVVTVRVDVEIPPIHKQLSKFAQMLAALEHAKASLVAHGFNAHDGGLPVVQDAINRAKSHDE